MHGHFDWCHRCNYALVPAVQRLDSGVLAINHDRLYQACTFFILTGEITVDELKNLEYLYEGYHALGGNGTGTELYEKCKDLPIVEKRIKRHESYRSSC